MRTLSTCTLLLALAVVATTPAHAATISLAPASADVAPGDVVSLDLLISGLGAQQAPSIGDFDIDLGFDPARLEFVAYTLGESLGDLGAFGALDVSFGEFGFGGFNVAEVSLLPAATLDAMQPDTFVLATLAFLVTDLGVGEMTNVRIDLVYALGDALGNPIAVDTTSGAVLTGISGVPAPAALWLLASAVASLRVRCITRWRLRRRG